MADLVFTDPPYGIGYQDLKGHHRPIPNDDADPEALVRGSLSLLDHDDALPVYVCCDWRSIGAMRTAVESAGIAPKALIVWDKQYGVQNLDRYHKQHELILYAGPYGGEPTLRGDVWAIPREPNPGDHPTPKPVELCGTAIRDSSAVGDLVLDPFGGSGSTLIAAEQLNRRAYLLELDPAYCDVIVTRWEDLTGHKARRTRG
jgi:DNA modification methylase